MPADVGSGPGSILISLVAGDYANLLQFRVGYYDALGREFETSAVALNAVPLPAALPLFASGLVGLGWLARRKRRQPLTKAVG
jgi:hypothetical protein